MLGIPLRKFHVALLLAMTLSVFACSMSIGQEPADPPLPPLDEVDPDDDGGAIIGEEPALLDGVAPENAGELMGSPYGRPPAPDLFYNYYVPPNAGSNPAVLYMAPRPIPQNVGHVYYTYQPLYPHEYLYPHYREYYTSYGNYHGYQGYGDRTSGNRTRVRWQRGTILPTYFYKGGNGNGSGGGGLGGGLRGGLGGGLGGGLRGLFAGCLGGGCYHDGYEVIDGDYYVEGDQKMDVYGSGKGLK